MPDILKHPFSPHCSFIPPPHNAGCQLVDEDAALYPEEGAVCFPARSSNFVAPFVEGHLYWASVVLTLARLGGGEADLYRSALLPRRYPRAYESACVMSSRVKMSRNFLKGYPEDFC